MIDIHAHFAEEGYDEEAELARIFSAGVTRLVLASDDLRHSSMHAQIAQTREGVFFTAGVHPSSARELLEGGEEYLQAIQALCQREKCIAVGEIGLDYHYPDTDKAAQEKAFILQLQLAKRLSLPVQIHSRDSAEDTLRILKEYGDCLQNGFLLHCYSYSVEVMERLLDMGAYFSFGGVTCFKNAKKTVACVARCPKERILTETDSPYLSPFRGEKNSPANIPVILNRLAEIKGERAEELQKQMKKNAFALFPKLK